MSAVDLTGIIGYVGLSSAFFLCCLLIFLCGYLQFRENESIAQLARVLTHLQTLLLLTAVVALGVLLQMGAFEYEQVFNAVETSMDWVERIGGLWSGQASSLLFWSMIMASASSLSIRISRKLTPAGYTHSVLLVLEIILLFFILPDSFISNPFWKFWLLPDGQIQTSFFQPANASLLVAVDGQGMNPQLRHPAMLLHPPTLYVGLIGLFLPYAFALAGLVQRDQAHKWIKPIFPIALISWSFLTVGMLLGSFWAYTILGWGGYWGWDAVEISGLLPWLFSFGLIHALRQIMRGKHFHLWAYFFSFSIVILILLGILITRSGILESVHAYTSGAMGPMLLVLILLNLGTVLILTIKRRDLLWSKTGKKPTGFYEQLLRWFNFCLVGLVVIYLYGQTLPLSSQIALGEKLAFSPAEYENASAPLLVLLLFITGLCPLSANGTRPLREGLRMTLWIGVCAAACSLAAWLVMDFSIAALIGFWAAGFVLLAWLYASIVAIRQLVKNGKGDFSRIGMYVVHLGLALMAVGIMGVEALTTDDDISIKVGESAMVSSHDFTLAKRERYINPDGNFVMEESLTLLYPSGKSRGLTASILHSTKTGSLSAEPATVFGLIQDVQVILTDPAEAPESKTDFHVIFFPLISWIWIGGGMMAGGGIISLAGGKRKG